MRSIVRLFSSIKELKYLFLLLLSLLKMVVHIAKEQGRRPNWVELEHAIKRNFSGLLEDDFNPVHIIMRNVGFPSEYFQVRIDIYALAWSLRAI